MIYLYWYLGIGVAVLAIVLGAQGLTRSERSESLRSALDAVSPKRKRLWYRISKQFVDPVLGAVAFVAVWPVFILEAKGALSKYCPPALKREPAFAVKRGHLHEPLTVLQIEAREMVADPMSAVPDLPFGHLHAAWKAFIEGVGVDDELWSFTATWQTPWGRNEIRAGYVVVRRGVSTAHFLTMRKELEDASSSVQGSMPPMAGAVFGDERALQ